MLAAAPGVVWVTRAANARHASLLRLDSRTGRVTGAGLAVGRLPQAVVSSGSKAWVMTGTRLARADLVTCPHGRCARAAPPASLPAAPAPVWLQSLQMVSARDGWALAWTAIPPAPARRNDARAHHRPGALDGRDTGPGKAAAGFDRNSGFCRLYPQAGRGWP
jgi:hypothetical protein